MRKRIKWTILGLAAALFLGGCSVKTVDQMYRLPERSQEYIELKSAMETEMNGLSFCAPVSGENQQTIQMADLNGDGDLEYLVYCKTDTEQQLNILVFDRIDGSFVRIDTIALDGTTFDRVDYIHMDGQSGVELVVGCKYRNPEQNTVSVFTFVSNGSVCMLTTHYHKFLMVDIENHGKMDLFVLRRGESELECGIAELYCLANGEVRCSNTVKLSLPVDQLKRVLVGKLSDGKTAVFAASAVGENSLQTDIFAYDRGQLINVFYTGLDTLRNDFVYADDIDDDGVTELPMFLSITPLEGTTIPESCKLIRWYAISSSGNMKDKLFTYHDVADGWYLKLDDEIAPHITIQKDAGTVSFYLWDAYCTSAQKLMTIYTQQDKNAHSGSVILLQTDSIVYSASVEPIAAEYAITPEKLVDSFKLILQDWNFGET